MKKSIPISLMSLKGDKKYLSEECLQRCLNLFIERYKHKPSGITLSRSDLLDIDEIDGIPVSHGVPGKTPPPAHAWFYHKATKEEEQTNNPASNKPEPTPSAKRLYQHELFDIPTST